MAAAALVIPVGPAWMRSEDLVGVPLRVEQAGLAPWTMMCWIDLALVDLPAMHVCIPSLIVPKRFVHRESSAPPQAHLPLTLAETAGDNHR